MANSAFPAHRAATPAAWPGGTTSERGEEPDFHEEDLAADGAAVGEAADGLPGALGAQAGEDDDGAVPDLPGDSGPAATSAVWGWA